MANSNISTISTNTGIEICKVRVRSHLRPYVQYERHRAYFYETRASSKTFVKNWISRKLDKRFGPQ
jgi:hypothetical protein